VRVTDTPIKTTKVIYLNYNHGIDQEKTNALIAIFNNLVNNGYEEVHFLINSGGGEVNAGISLYNYIKSLPIKIIMHNMGMVASIANVVFLAGEERYACPHATFLFHGVTYTLNTQLTAHQLGEIFDMAQKEQTKIIGIISDSTTITKKTLEKLFTQGETQNSQFAIQYGLIKKIGFPEIPQDAQIVTINFDQQPS
jgi:ATP-dependent Clp protease protease subunit